MLEHRIGRREMLQWMILWAGASLGRSQTSRGVKLYVTNSLGDDITLVDLKTMKWVGNIVVGERPHGVAAQADGRLLFTTIESEQSLKVINTGTNKVIDTIPLSGRPNQCAATPNGRYVAVPIRDGDRVEIVDMKQRAVAKTLPVKVPHNCFNAGDNERIFVTSMGENKVNMIDLKTMTYSAEIPVGGVPRPLSVTSDERTMYVALSNLHGFVIVDIPQRRVIQKVELPASSKTSPLYPGTPTHGLALSPNGRELWVTSTGDGGIYVFDVATKKLSSEIHVGEGPNWVTFSPDGQYCCVSNTGSNDCSILDTLTRQEVARVSVGKAPKRLLAVNVPEA